MTSNGVPITGYKARLYDFRGPLWNRIKSRHVGLVNSLPGQRLLDVGCGTGSTLWLLRQRYKDLELHGVEPSDDMLEVARKKFRDGTIVLRSARAQALPYPNDHFDFVISTQVLHHLPVAEKKKMLEEMHRVLKPDGTIVMSDWAQPTNLFGSFLSFLWRNHAYVKENDQILNVASFRSVGIKHVREHIQFGIVHHISGTKKTAPQL